MLGLQSERNESRGADGQQVSTHVHVAQSAATATNAPQAKPLEFETLVIMYICRQGTRVIVQTLIGDPNVKPPHKLGEVLRTLRHP